MKKNLILFVIIFSFFSTNAQEKYNLTKNLFKINIITPGITYEKRICKNSSVCLDTDLSIGFSIKNNKSYLVASPFLRGQYRYYYNLEKRLIKNKSISNNSGNFISLSSSYYFNSINNKDIVSVYDGFTIGCIWGLQRTYKNNINITINSGIGYNTLNESKTNNTIVPIINFTLGWVLGK